jgi:hypothetical protein
VKAYVLLGLMLLGASCAFAQGGMRSGLPPAHPATRPADGRTHPGFGHRFFPAAFPLLLGDYYDYPGYSPAPNVVVVQQTPPLYVLVPQAPADPPKPEIHEYNQPAAPQPQVSADEQQAFAIILRDGTVHSAVAVTVQGNALHYVEPDGRHRLVSLDAVDRDATSRLNRERKLQLQLPP